MEYIISHIPKDTRGGKRPCNPMTPEYITIHNTGNPTSTALNERNWLTSKDNAGQASFHFAVDEWWVIECLPLDENGWHAGDGKNGAGNRKSIGIEICESGNYGKALDNAMLLTATLLRERGWGIDKLRRHYDWTGKICPRLMFSGGSWQGWYDFKMGVMERMLKMNELEQHIKELTQLAVDQAKTIGTLQGKVDKLTERISGTGDLAEWAKVGKAFVTVKRGYDGESLSDGMRPTATITRQEVWTMIERYNRLCNRH